MTRHESVWAGCGCGCRDPLPGLCFSGCDHAGTTPRPGAGADALPAAVRGVVSVTTRMRRRWAVIGILVMTGCGSIDITVPTPASTELLSVTPTGGSTGVSNATLVAMTFSEPMMSGMDQYLDLHHGDAAGPLVPVTCVWSADRTTVTCAPSQPLDPNTTYTIHIGAGMMDAGDHPVGLQSHMAGNGGEWFMPMMMGDMHAGMPVNGMASGWKGANGSFGMLFSFTTG